MKIFIFNKSKIAKPAGNADHIYVPTQFEGKKIVGIVVADDSENVVYQHAQLKKCADCAMLQAL